MNRIKLLEELTGLDKLKKVIAIKPHHTNNRVSIIVTNQTNNVFEVTIANTGTYGNKNLVISHQFLDSTGVSEEDIKDVFRINKVDMQLAEVFVNKAEKYSVSFEQWGMTVDDLKGHVNVDRAIVSDYYTIDSAELKYNSKLLVVNYSSKTSNQLETVYYVNYSPIAHDNELEAEKAALARRLFGADNADAVINRSDEAEIVREDEFEKLNDIQRLRFNRIGDSEFFVRFANIDVMPTGDKVETMIKRIIDNKLVYNSNYVIDKGLHQGHLSEMRNGKRDVNRMTLNNVCKYLDAYKY